MNTISKLLSLVFIATMISCNSDEIAPIEMHEEATSSDAITISQTQFEQGKMELGGFEKSIFKQSIHTNGILTVAPENKSVVSAYFGGYVKNISLMEGQQVSKGQVLFTLENPEYIQIQQEFLETKSQLIFLESDYLRQQELAKENVTSQKNYSKAEADYKVTLAQHEGLKKKLQLMGINPSNVSETNLRSSITVSSPISGYITEVVVSQGMFLNPSDIALTIVNTDNLLLELTIFEQDLEKVALNQEVSFSIQGSLKNHYAAVYLINKTIDTDNRTIKLYCQLKENNSALTPGMFVEAEIYAANDSSMALNSQAIISMDNQDYVLVKNVAQENGLSFTKRKVIKGLSNNNFTEILNIADFDSNAQFLTKGAFNLISE